MKYTLFFSTILFCIFSCKHLVPKEEENDLKYFLSNSWELISSGESVHNLKPIGSIQDTIGYPIVKLTLHNSCSQDSTFRVYVWSFLDGDEIIIRSSSLEVGFYSERRAQFHVLSHIVYDGFGPPPDKNLLQRHLDPISIPVHYPNYPKTKPLYPTIDDREITCRVEVFKRESDGDKIIVKHESSISNTILSSNYQLYQKMRLDDIQ